MRVLIVTDAWRPQVNGVVRSLEYMAEHGPSFGAEVLFLTPEGFRSVPMPTYPDIRLSLAGPVRVGRIIAEAVPDHVHIATEGPLGWSARIACRRQRRGYTTSYHTRFPEYLAARLPVPEACSYAVLRRFHREAKAIMVSTPSLERELSARGFRNIVRWTRGVDTTLFRPRYERVLDYPGPIFLYVGRVAVEKNLPAFLSLDLPGTKVVVGDGPARHDLERQYREARFLGALAGEDLAQVYASSDVFVFPSLTDTFGIVLLEALASGLPIAAFPVTGPVDVVGSSGCGVIDPDLRKAALAALDIPRSRCRAHGETFTWSESARQFFSHIKAAHAT
ncbi:glycosyltransferase family 4 protein [Microvirga makkahensis]|uniref:Glycosyltransferase n=1 Tax=Microvirga makkahensis TaxID=1128670 RepID=A0A7X3MMX3_9HYPH|nr:glycosyltransferase family 1 protein [Microvirga makkahensis]MXQ10031.1 glycosyltransferase [Microvirga makkahensis]